MRISVLRFVNSYQGFLGSAGLGLFPVGVQARHCISKTPYEIVWSTDQDYFKSDSQHTLLDVLDIPTTEKPSFIPNRMTQARSLLYSKTDEHSKQNNQHPFATEYRQTQDIIDAAKTHLSQMQDPEQEVLQVMEQARSYGMKFENLLYLTVLQSAFLNDQSSIEITAKLYAASAKLVPGYAFAQALLMDAAAAYDVQTFASAAATAWGRAFTIELDPIWDPILIFAGLRRSLIAENYDLATGLLLRLRKLYPNTGYEHDLRIAWSSLKAVAETSRHPGKAWLSAAVRLRHASCLWETDPAHYSHVQDLSCFAASAEIAGSYYKSIL